MSLEDKTQAQIDALRTEPQRTLRACAPELDKVLYQRIPVLDHGFIRVVDYMGNDAAIVQAARVSYGSGTRKISEDAGLIRYLMRHRHSTPFEMCEIKFHVKLPIFVARQWIRHRTANVNEYSARYSILDKEFYVPDSEYLRLTQIQTRSKKISESQADMFGDTNLSPEVSPTIGAQSTSNKQGRESGLETDEALEAIKIIKAESSRSYSNYEKLLNENIHGEPLRAGHKGLARELARMVLPVNYYTQWYWKIDLHNLLHFVSLRADSHAQYEIRVYADAICDLLGKWVPIAYQAFRDYRMGGFHFSANALDVVRRLLAGEKVEQKESGLSAREWRELMAVLGRENTE